MSGVRRQNRLPALSRSTRTNRHAHIVSCKVEEKEKKRDTAVEEMTALKEAEEGEAAGAEKQKKRIQAAESEGRRILEESQRLEVELRKLRVRYQVSRARRATTLLLFVGIFDTATTSTCDGFGGEKLVSVH